MSAYKPPMIREDFIDFLLEKINPLWRVRQARARIDAIEPLPDRMVKITLTPNRHLKAWQPGQFIMLSVRIDGILQQRAYSIVSLAGEPLQIAIKQQGKVSTYLATQAQVGDYVELAQPAGNFLLPKNFSQQPKPLLLLATGSGITPMLPLLRTALPVTQLPVTLLYYCQEAAFEPELTRLAAQYSQFDLHIIKDGPNNALFSLNSLLELVPDAGERLTYVCAAPAVMQLSRDIWHEQGWSEHLIQESFLPVTIDVDAPKQPVHLRRSMREFEAQGNLLASAEAVGLKPASGCRMGICNTCVCTKVSGSTRDLLTGLIDSEPNRQIKLCINEAVSPVELDL